MGVHTKNEEDDDDVPPKWWVYLLSNRDIECHVGMN